jgi:hypothetical protein
LNFQTQLLETIVEGLAKKVTEIEDVGDIKVLKEYDPNFTQEVLVVCVESPKNSVRITVDPQTKLPLSIHFIKTSELGNVIKDYDRIIFDQEPPTGLFDFVIPEGATVVDQDKSDKFINDPNFGMALDGLSKQEAAELLVVKYWQDLIGSDLEELRKIWPSANNENFEAVLKQFFGDNPPVELVEMRELGKEYGCPIGDVLPCIIRHQDGTLKEYKVLVGLRETDSKTSCIVYGFCGISQEID